MFNTTRCTDARCIFHTYHAYLCLDICYLEELSGVVREALRRAGVAEQHVRDMENTIARALAATEVQKADGNAALQSARAEAAAKAKLEADAKADAAARAAVIAEKIRREGEAAGLRAEVEAAAAAAEFEAQAKDASSSLQAAHKTIRRLEEAVSSAQASHAQALRQDREGFERELASALDGFDCELAAAAAAAAAVAASATVAQGVLSKSLEDAHSRGAAADKELFTAQAMVGALEKKCRQLEKVIEDLKDGAGAAEEMAVTAVRKTLGKALEDSTATRDQIEAVGEKIVSLRLEVAPGMGESEGGSGEDGNGSGSGGGSAGAEYAAAMAEWRDAMDFISFSKSNRFAVEADPNEDGEPKTVEEAVVEAVGQIVWRFTRLDKLARAAAGVAVVAIAARASVCVTEKERELEMSVKKLTRAEEAVESAVTCMACMGVFKQPVTCVPCGHTYCGECYVRGGDCPECGADVEHVVEATLLESVASKYEYRLTTLRSLARLVAS